MLVFVIFIILINLLNTGGTTDQYSHIGKNFIKYKRFIMNL